MESDGPGLRKVTGEEDPKWIWDYDDGFNVAQSPSISPDGTRIAYAAYQHDRWWLPEIEDFQWDIVTSALDGSDRRRLTEGGSYLSPAWSPDGSRIAFVSLRWLQTIDSDGSNRRPIASGIRIAADRSPPVWSSDSRRLAFIAREPDSPDGAWFHPVTTVKYPVMEVLYTVGADGTGLTRIGEAAGTPSWSPDGGRIAFARSDSDTHVAIVTTDPDGANEKTLFESSEVRTAMGIIDLAWSPDGARLAIVGLVVRWDSLMDQWDKRLRLNALSIVNADYPNSPRLMATLGLSHRSPSWSPDGSRIAVHDPDAGSAGGAVKTIYAAEARRQAGQDATPVLKSTPSLAQPLPATPNPPATSTSSVMPGPSSESTPACEVGSDASCAQRDVSGFGPFSAGGGAAGPEPLAVADRSTGRAVGGTC